MLGVELHPPSSFRLGDSLEGVSRQAPQVHQREGGNEQDQPVQADGSPAPHPWATAASPVRSTAYGEYYDQFLVCKARRMPRMYFA